VDEVMMMLNHIGGTAHTKQTNPAISGFHFSFLIFSITRIVTKKHGKSYEKPVNYAL